MPLSVITLEQRVIDNINQTKTISNRLLIENTQLLVIWDLVNLGQFDHNNHMITLSVIIIIKQLTLLNITYDVKFLNSSKISITGDDDYKPSVRPVVPNHCSAEH